MHSCQAHLISCACSRHPHVDDLPVRPRLGYRPHLYAGKRFLVQNGDGFVRMVRRVALVLRRSEPSGVAAALEHELCQNKWSGTDWKEQFTKLYKVQLETVHREPFPSWRHVVYKNHCGFALKNIDQEIQVRIITTLPNLPLCHPLPTQTSTYIYIYIIYIYIYIYIYNIYIYILKIIASGASKIRPSQDRWKCIQIKLSWIAAWGIEDWDGLEEEWGQTTIQAIAQSST